MKDDNGEAVNNNSISEICSLPGWKRQVKVRQIGSRARQMDVYYISQSGMKLRSKPHLIRYCNNNQGWKKNL